MIVKKKLASTDSKVISTANGSRDEAGLGDKLNVREGSNDPAFWKTTLNSGGFVDPVSNERIPDVHPPVPVKALRMMVWSVSKE